MSKEVILAQLNIRMDDQLKRNAEEMYREMGLTLSAAVSLFIKQSLNKREIPFRILAADAPNAETVKAMNKSNEYWMAKKKNPKHKDPEFIEVGKIKNKKELRKALLD
jgi:DNA-damage-inducible protein J